MGGDTLLRISSVSDILACAHLIDGTPWAPADSAVRITPPSHCFSHPVKRRTTFSFVFQTGRTGVLVSSKILFEITQLTTRVC